MDRRTFLQTGSVAAAAALVPQDRSATKRIERIGVQLYTVRDEMAQDAERTLARVAEIGYQEVEFAGYFGRSPADLRKALDRLRLTAPSAHVPYETLREGWDRVLDAAATIGHQWVLVAWAPQEERRTLDDWRRIAEAFNRAGRQARAFGLRFGYHNHDFEFAPLEGRIPFDYLLAGTDPEAVQIEMDLYWITKAGQDPRAYFARYPGRFPLVHVKDSAGAPQHTMVDVGAGTIDWKKIFALDRQAGIRHYYVEHDAPADPFASITASYRYLKRLRF